MTPSSGPEPLPLASGRDRTAFAAVVGIVGGAALAVVGSQLLSGSDDEPAGGEKGAAPSAAAASATEPPGADRAAAATRSGVRTEAAAAASWSLRPAGLPPEAPAVEWRPVPARTVARAAGGDVRVAGWSVAAPYTWSEGRVDMLGTGDNRVALKPVVAMPALRAALAEWPVLVVVGEAAGSEDAESDVRATSRARVLGSLVAEGAPGRVVWAVDLGRHPKGAALQRPVVILGLAPPEGAELRLPDLQELVTAELLAAVAEPLHGFGRRAFTRLSPATAAATP